MRSAWWHTTTMRQLQLLLQVNANFTMRARENNIYKMMVNTGNFACGHEPFMKGPRKILEELAVQSQENQNNSLLESIYSSTQTTSQAFFARWAGTRVSGWNHTCQDVQKAKALHRGGTEQMTKWLKTLLRRPPYLPWPLQFKCKQAAVA